MCSALDGGRRHGLWQAAAHCFALAAPIGRRAGCALPSAASAQQAGRGRAAQAGSCPLRDVLKGDRARTRFIIGLERAVDFQVFSLTNPNRVFVELPDVMLQLPPQPGETAVGLVKSFRGGQSAPGKARVVIDVTGPVIVDKAAIEKSKDGKTTRLVLEIVPAEPAAARKADAKRAHAAGRRLRPRRRRRAAAHAAAGRVAAGARARHVQAGRSSSIPVTAATIPGAQKNGTVEKNVVLAFSLMLRDKLNATGRYKVLMTRDTDVFVELNKRREFAERNLASLFVAVHADYAQAKARGATIYSLRESVANCAAALGQGRGERKRAVRQGACRRQAGGGRHRRHQRDPRRSRPARGGE